MRVDKIIAHWYEVQRDLFASAIRGSTNDQAGCRYAVNA